jgi:hypothetical protein
MLVQRLDRCSLSRRQMLRSPKHKISESPWSVLLFFPALSFSYLQAPAVRVPAETKRRLNTSRLGTIGRRSAAPHRAECMHAAGERAAHVNYNFTSKKTREYRSMWFNRKSSQPLSLKELCIVEANSIKSERIYTPRAVHIK